MTRTSARDQRPGNGLTSITALRESAARGAVATQRRSQENDDEIMLLAASMDPLETERYGHSVLRIVQGIMGKGSRTEASDATLARLNAACLLIALDDETEAWARGQERLKRPQPQGATVVQMDLFAGEVI